MKCGIFQKIEAFFCVIEKGITPPQTTSFIQNIPKTPPKLTQTSNYDARKIR